MALLKNYGFKWMFYQVIRKIWIRKSFLFEKHGLQFSEKKGIEVGGPSFIFKPKGLLPLYTVLGDLDNCNFSDNTIWEGNIKEKKDFCFNSKRPLGKQYILEATDLNGIDS